MADLGAMHHGLNGIESAIFVPDAPNLEGPGREKAQETQKLRIGLRAEF